MEGGRFGDVTNQFVRTAVDTARSRGVVLGPSGQEAIGNLASSVAETLSEDDLLGDAGAVSRAERSIVQVIDALPTAEFAERQGRSLEANEFDVNDAVAGLCPGLWPIC